MSHIPHFGDATTSPAGDAASPAGDGDVSAEDAASPAGDAVSPPGDLLASPNFGIYDTTLSFIRRNRFRFI